MPSYKPLASVAHNFAHSFLSLTNYDAGNYIVMHILAIAAHHQTAQLTIDVLREAIEPPCFATHAITNSLHRYRQWLPQMLERQNCHFSQLQSFYITIQFSAPNVWQKLSRQPYTCYAKIVDDRGRVHQKAVAEWWQY